MSRQKRRWIGVDMGGTRLKAGLVEAGQLTRSLICKTPSTTNPEAVLSRVQEMVLELEPNPTSVGFAIPGEVDAEGHCYRLCNIPGFEGVPIAKKLSQILGCPVVVENDATAATLGELKYGAGRKYADFLLLTLGTGIGGGLSLGGQVRRGRNGFAGEFGHVQIDRTPRAPECACGQRGCVEAFAGTEGIRRAARERGLIEQDIKTLALLATSGDQQAQLAFTEAGRALGEGIATAQTLLDLEAIVFAGGISNSFELLESAARAALHRRAYAEPLAEIPFLVSPLGEEAGIIGAALLPQELGST